MNMQSLPRPLKLVDILPVFLGVCVSVALIYFVTEDALVTLAFAGGVTVLGCVGLAAARRRGGAAISAAEEGPDWSVTVAAIEQPNVAIAITDRANRLVCANAGFENWFGSNQAPPRLSIDPNSTDLLNRIARAAWRDGASGEELTVTSGDDAWNVSAARAGRAGDYLVWRFALVEKAETLKAVAQYLSGSVGRILGDAGISAALVAPDGMIRSVNPSFAERASGDGSASLAGQDFVTLLRSDEQERIFFAREGRQGSPQMLVQVPFSDVEENGGSIAWDDNASEEPPSLMLLLDSGIGLGGFASDANGQTPQVEALLDRLPLGLAATDRDGHILFANPAFRRAAGIEQGDLPPYPSDLVIPQDKTAMSDAVRRYGQGAASSGDIALRLRGQPDEPVSLGLSGVRGLGETAVLISLTDSTEEARLKRQVVQATKMQAVGQLAGGVAHDFNNVLTAIIGYCDLMLLRHTPGDSDYDDIQQIKANSNRAASLTRQLLAFSRQQTLQPEVIQLPDVLSEVSQLLKRLLGAKITLRVNHDRGLGPVRADPRQLEQVIVNLAVNARDAIQSGKDGEQASGTLTLATRRVAAKDIRRMGSEIIPAGDYTALIAEDTGSGIPPDVLGKIFEPFFTTKDMGKGTGLGLSTVYGIVKQSGGFIFASNAKDAGGKLRGARFTIYLPVHQLSDEDIAKEKAAEDEVKEEVLKDWSGGGHILLVEDEEMVRAVAERALTRQGYTVVTAADGDEGLEAVQEGGKFDLVVSDVVMPHVDGPAMAREIRKLQPDLPVLFMSGYAEAQLRSEIDFEAMHFISKPFSVQQIADKVLEVMAAHKAKA